MTINEQIIDVIAAGNKVAFDQLFLFYYKDLCRFAVTFINDWDEAEDVVQKFFIRLWERRKFLTRPDDLKAFVFRSIYNECLNEIRNRKREKEHVDSMAFLIELDRNNEYKELSTEVVQHLNRAINALPKKAKQIFVLNKIEGLTQREIADYLSVSPKTVENQIANAIKKLKVDLKPIMHLLPASFFFFQNF